MSTDGQRATAREVMCVSDSYDAEPDVYDSVADFLAMCVECYGRAPELVERDGRWYGWRLPDYIQAGIMSGELDPSDYADAREVGLGSEVLVLISTATPCDVCGSEEVCCNDGPGGDWSLCRAHCSANHGPKPEGRTYFPD